MRTYRIRAEMKETPDVDKLAQLFINMALSRARAGRADDPAAHSTSRQDAHGEVES
jgi:hypothetical protein